LKADNEILDRQKELYEHTTITHMLCIVILASAITLCKKFYIPGDIINMRSFALVSLLGLGIIFLLRSKDTIPFETNKSLSHIELGYVGFPLLIAFITVIMAGGSLDSIEIILLLPVLITASIMGKRAGLVMATVCAILLFVYELSMKTPLQVLFESNLIVISMMYVVGWFIGGVINIESEHRAHLKTSLNSVKEEITRREKVEEQLRKLTGAVEQGPSIVVITDTFGNIEYVNKKFTQVTGYLLEETIGRNISEIVGTPSEPFQQNWGNFDSCREWHGELENTKKNGDSYWESVSICPFRNHEGIITHFLRVSEDITESKRMEKEMARLDRLNLVGEMAAGLGHEIRNPMTSVRGFLQLLSTKKECLIYKGYFDLMIDELDRANSIITEYLTMAKDKAIVLELKSLNSIITTMQPLLFSDATKSEKKIYFALQEMPDLLLDEKEIRQLILNLVRNGLEAMRPGGALTIKTYLEDTEAVLSVQDQGSGISPEVLEKIGTPFFTTKDTGTGLGLAVCYSIAARHNASLKVATGPGGTTFYVRFKLI
jgi:two-component system sporulation sensor kinase C